MINEQEIMQFIAAATTGNTEEYKSKYELLKLIAQCIDKDEETGDLYIRVKEVEE